MVIQNMLHGPCEIRMVLGSATYLTGYRIIKNFTSDFRPRHVTTEFYFHVFVVPLGTPCRNMNSRNWNVSC